MKGLKPSQALFITSDGVMFLQNCAVIEWPPTLSAVIQHETGVMDARGNPVLEGITLNFEHGVIQLPTMQIHAYFEIQEKNNDHPADDTWNG